MSIRSFLKTCSSSATFTRNSIYSGTPTSKSHVPVSSPKLPSSDTSTSSSASSVHHHESSPSTSTSLQSNLSLQTLPSVPSLQQSLPSNLNLAASHSCVTTAISLKPPNNNATTSNMITSLAISGTLLYVASGTGINVFDISDHYAHVDAFNVKDSRSGSVKSIAFSNGKVFTGHQDCRIRVWQITATKRHELQATLPTIKDRLRRFALPKNYVSVRRHKKRLWIEHADAVSGVSVSGRLVYSVSWDKCLKIWNAKDLMCLESVKAHEDAVNAVAVSRDGTVYTGSADARINVWAKSFGEKRHGLVATLEKHKSAVNALALSDDGSMLFSGACDRSILVWEREDSANHMALTGALRGHTGAILCLVSVSDRLVSGSADRSVRVWLRGGDSQFCCLAVMEGHEKPVKSLVAVWEGISGGGEFRVCSGSLDGEIKVWHIVISNSYPSPSPSPSLSSHQSV